MSGVVKAVGKVFKKVAKAVGKVVKAIAPIAIPIAAAVFAAPALFGGVGAIMGGAPGSVLTAGAAGTALAGVAPQAGAAVGAGLTGASAGGIVSKLLSSPVLGSVIGGVGEGLMRKQELKSMEKMEKHREARQAARYEGAGEAASFDFSKADGDGGSSSSGHDAAFKVASRPLVRDEFVRPITNPVTPTGLGPQQVPLQQTDPQTAPALAGMTDTTAVALRAPSGRPARPSAVEQANAPPRMPRYRYNPETGRIDYA